MRQRGSITLWLAGAILLGTVGAGAVWAYNSALREAVQAKAELATLQTAHQEQLTENTQLRLRQAQLNQLLAAREAERHAVAAIERKIDATLAHIYRSNPQARAWADQPVPPAVLDSLRHDASGARGADGARAPAGGAAGAKPGR